MSSAAGGAPSGGLDERGVLALLNGLGLGELSRVQQELAGAADRLTALGHADLADLVRAARASLSAGDVGTFRRTISTVTARLGHLK